MYLIMFWKDKPLNEEIPMEIICKSKLQKDKYLFIKHKNTDDLNLLLDFLNNNYFCRSDRFRFKYSHSQLQYFLKNGGWASVYSYKFPETIIGVVAYREIRLNDLSTSSEVDFLCIKEELRGISLAEFIINMVTSWIIDCGINTCFFTGMDLRNIPSYSKKKVYIYILNYEKSIKSKYTPLCLMKGNKWIEDTHVYAECKDYIGITDTYNDLYVIEELRKEECFIDYIVDSKFLFRFMKIDIVSTDTVIKSVILHYSNTEIARYINNIGYLIYKKHGIDSITIYSNSNLGDKIESIYDTRSNIYFYAYNKRINCNIVSMNPI